jgi:hypothetical protein
MTMKRIASSLIAGAALLGAQAAQAQTACVEPADLDDTIRYAMPTLYEAAMASCGDQYSPTGFMKTQGPAFADGFRALQSEAWPGTLRVIQLFAARGGEAGDAANPQEAEQMAALIAALPEDALRPFLDAMVLELVSGEIKPESCASIERGIELIAPLPPRNVSGLVAFIAEQAKVDNPPICKPEGESAAE